MRYAIIVLALLGVLASPRPAAALTGNQLLRACGSAPSGEIACSFYVMGWRDAFMVTTVTTYKAAEMLEHNPKMTVCIPKAVENGQIKGVVLKYLRAHPATLHKDVAVLTWMAMKEAFPCR